MSDNCPLCGVPPADTTSIVGIPGTKKHGETYRCKTHIDPKEGTTSWQGTECRLRCELADAKDLLAEGVFALQKTINERDAAYEAIRWADELMESLQETNGDCDDCYIRDLGWRPEMVTAVVKAKEAKP